MRLLPAITLIGMLSIVAGCSSGASSDPGKPHYDSISGIYSIHDPDLSFRLPRPETSVVADPETLPEHLSMCIVDTSASAAVFLFNLPDVPRTKYAAEEAVRQIAMQNNPDFNVDVVSDVAPDSFMNTAGWRFNVDLTLSRHADSLAVTYRGYLAGRSAFVVTAESRTFTDSLFNSYSAGLTRNEKPD